MYQISQDMLEEKIRKVRSKMIESAQTNGLTNEVTIKRSEELDQLIFQYQKNTYKSPKPHEEGVLLFQQIMLFVPNVLLDIEKMFFDGWQFEQL